MDIGAAATDEQRESTFRFLNDEISEQHRFLLEEARSIDTKATLITGFAAAAITFLLNNRRGWRWVLALAVYGLAIALGVMCLWPRRWDGLLPRAVQERLGEGSPVFVTGRVAGTKVAIYERNHHRVLIKILCWTASVILLVVASALAVWSTLTEDRHG